MTDIDLRAFVARSRALVDASPPTTARETRAWLVDPLLETLGWDARAGSRPGGTTVDGTRFEYVCAVDATPALFVAVEPFPDSLERDRASAICRTMAWTGVDRAIYTNGRQLLLLAGTSDVDQFSCALAEVADHESSLAHFTRGAASRRLEGHSRAHVARTLALERSALVDSIVDRLMAVGGSAHEDEFASAADRFLEGLVASFGTDEAAASDPDDGGGVSIEFTDPTSDHGFGSGDPARGERPAGADTLAPDSRPADEAGSTDDGERTDTRPGSGDASSEDESDDSGDGDDTESDDGEYVVRFFNDRGSIGAIGHSTSGRALLHAAEYCFDRGLSGVSVPWSPSDGDETVLNDEPVRADGSPMASPAQLSNGYYLETSGDDAERAARVESLASRAGLRAMLTGDWE